MKILRSIPLCALAGALFSTLAMAQSAAPAVRIVTPIDEGQLVTLKGNINPHANAANDRGAVSASFAMPDLTLVLSRSAEQQAAFDAYVAGEYDSSSPNYHQWLTPQQIGAQFGPAQADIATITNWLAGHGFAIKGVSPDGMTIKFAGTAGTVQSAFHTSIHNLSVKGVAHYANMTDPQIPAAIAPVVVGVKALHNFLPRPLHRVGSVVRFNKQAGGWQRVSTTAVPTNSPAPRPMAALTPFGAKAQTTTGAHPDYGTSYPTTAESLPYLEEDVSPYDFATIYNVTPLWNNSITGSNQTIAIAGTSDIDLADVASFRSAFSLPAGLTPKQIDTGDGPAASECTSTSPSAFCGIDDLLENSLDTEWSGAVAQNAQIDLVVTGQNASGTIDTIYDSAQYVVSNLTAKILSVSYGECELGQGTSANLAYYNLWQAAAAEGISVFVATGDSGSPGCDEDMDESYGNPYTAQYGLSVSGMASTPYNTAVGGTDFSWCQPYYSDNGNAISGCPATAGTASGDTPYWNASNAANGSSAAGYVPEIPWNDTCENPIWAKFIESVASLSGGGSPTTPEESCSYVYNNWSSIYENDEYMTAYFVDAVGGSGGASNCVVNSTNPNSEALGTCSSSATSVTNGAGSIALTNDGWQAPSWQTASGVTGTSGLTTRAVPDVSFFAGDGSLNSATLVCVSALAPCTYSNSSDIEELEVGGTSVATPQMAGVMALINQKAGAAQGLANKELYTLAGQQNYSSCSAESVKTSSSCYFQDIDNGPTGYSAAQTNSMPCNLANSEEGGAIYDNGQWESYGPFAGTTSPDCTALNSGDTVGTLTSGGTAAYNGAVGYDMATGLGSMNVANVVNAWVSDAGTHASTLAVTLNPSTSTLSAGTQLIVSVTVTGSVGTPTGIVSVSGGGYSNSGSLSSTVSGTSTTQITIPAGSLAVGSDTLTITYSGDTNYATTSTTEALTITAAPPTVTVSAPASDNLANPVPVTVTVTGAAGVPQGTVTIAQTNNGGTYSAAGVSLTASSGGLATFTIPASQLTVGADTLTATYVGTGNYTSGTGTTSITIVGGAAPPAPTIAISVSTSSTTNTNFYTSQALTVGITVTGSGTAPTGTAWLTAGSYSSLANGAPAAVLTNGVASFTVPANTFTAGSQTLTVNYSGDANYLATSSNKTITITQSSYALAAAAASPTSVAPGNSVTSTITGVTPTASTNSDYSGTVSFNSNSCAMTGGPTTGTAPTCNISGSITFTDGTPTGSATATVSTTSGAIVELARPKLGNGKGLLGAGGGAVLAFLVFLGVPARRKSWRAMLGMVVLLVALGSLAACGGGSSGSVTGATATSAGTYTFTVTGSGSDPASTTASTTFTVVVN